MKTHLIALATLTLGADGEAVHRVAIAREQGVVDVTAYYAGDGATAPRHTTIHVNLDAPYVTVDLVAPAGGVTLGAGDAPFVVTMHVGEVVSFPVRGQGVELREHDRVIASGVTDAVGSFGSTRLVRTGPSSGDSCGSGKTL